jgi:outer membrane lipoprotein-sorting protein
MKRMTTTIAAALAIMLTMTAGVAIAAEDDPKARAIMERVDARDDGSSQISSMEMILIDKGGHERKREMRSFRKDIGEDLHTIIFFVSPPDVENTGFLTYDYDDAAKDDDQWLYLPALRKTKRIASNEKDGSFMGSDFAYADMTRRNLEEYTFKILKEDNVRGEKVWVIEVTPVSQTIIDKYGYEKSVVFVRQDIDMVVRGVNWLKSGGKLKYMDVKELEQIDGVWVAKEIEMTTKNGKVTEHSTIMKFSNISMNPTIEEDLFSIRRLEKGM